jgi:DNA modification methylase
VPTTVYNLTIEGIPAFDTLIGVSHNTQKPAELAAIPVMNNTNTGDIVVDCFAGSHSTLIACELLHRRARTIDFEPKFVAVGLERWARLTNREPVLIS